jgi:hypothetical protein
VRSFVLQRLREPGSNLTLRLDRREETALAMHAALTRLHTGKLRREDTKSLAPPSRVLARETVSAAQSRRESSPAPWDSAPPAAVRAVADRWPEPSSRTAVASPPPAVNVEALADKVMHQIDRRLHAWRERHGGF